MFKKDKKYTTSEIKKNSARSVEEQIYYQKLCEIFLTLKKIIKAQETFNWVYFKKEQIEELTLWWKSEKMVSLSYSRASVLWVLKQDNNTKTETISSRGMTGKETWWRAERYMGF